MKKIKIKYLGFSDDFIQNCFLTKCLKKNFDVEFSDTPDYVIAGCWSKEYLEYDCIRIFYTGENLCPDFNLFDYAIAFNNIDYEDRYYRAPIWLIYPEYYKIVANAMHKHENVEEGMAHRSFCASVVSRYGKYISEERDILLDNIDAYKSVAMGGRYRNNIGGPVVDKLEFQKRYKFACAFENVSHPGYLTEKIVDAFAAVTVPIYWGDPKVESVFNSKAFVNVGRYSSVSELMKKIEEIDTNEDLYMCMLNEKAFVCDDFVETKQKGLEEFLVHIFEQEYKNAFRRDTVGYGLIHNNQLLEYKKIDTGGKLRNASKKYIFGIDDDFFRLAF